MQSTVPRPLTISVGSVRGWPSLISNFENINFWSTAKRTLEKIKKSGGETTTGKTRLVWIKRKPF